MGPEALAQVLRPLRKAFDPATHPNLLVGLEVSDDAAVYRISEDQAIIQTTDFFPPVVDDPYTYGAIAAANAMSDVYAMGGEVILALNIAAFPDNLPPEITTEIFRGGAEKVAEGGGVIAGGHTISDPEPKYGLAVTGVVHPDRIITKAGAHPGDIMVLTKPLGSGVITTAGKNGSVQTADLEAAVRIMLTLSRTAAQIMQEVGVHAATDITGFSLLGHACEMAEASGVALYFKADDIPFISSALSYAAAGHVPGGTGRNQAYFESRVHFANGVPPDEMNLLFDPQTSGGLLISVAADRLGRMTDLFDDAAQSYWIVGHIEEGQGVTVV